MKTQIWIAVSVYVLVAIVKKRLALDASLYTLLQVLSLTLFEKMPILQALSQQPLPPEHSAVDNQLNLFESQPDSRVPAPDLNDDLKGWMLRFRGAATKYLDSYLGWHRMNDRDGDTQTARRVLATARG